MAIRQREGHDFSFGTLEGRYTLDAYHITYRVCFCVCGHTPSCLQETQEKGEKREGERSGKVEKAAVYL